ncbi:ribonuclease H-like domain-containing protein [Tanacetum coccineum]
MQRQMLRISVRQYHVETKMWSVDFDAVWIRCKRDYQTRQLLLRCDSTGDLYPITQQPSSTTTFALLLLSPTTWYRRIGHPSEDVLRRLESSHFISYNKTKLPALCHACQLGKHTRLPFYSSESNVGSVFDIIHSDLWTSPISSESGIKYYAIFWITSRIMFGSGISKPLARMNCHATTTLPIPRSHLHALRDPNWHKAMVDEYNALISNGTWALVPRPANVNIVRSMWLFKHKGSYVAYLSICDDIILTITQLRTALSYSALLTLLLIRKFLSVLTCSIVTHARPLWTLSPNSNSDGGPCSVNPTFISKPSDHKDLSFNVSSTSQLTAYTDADWAGCPVTRRSTSGIVVPW